MFGDLLEARREPVGMLRSHRGEGLQHDQVERSLEQFNTIGSCCHLVPFCQRVNADLHLPSKRTTPHDHTLCTRMSSGMMMTHPFCTRQRDGQLIDTVPNLSNRVR